MPSYNIGSCACCAPVPTFLYEGQIWIKIDMAFTRVLVDGTSRYLITPTYELISACPIPPGLNYPSYRSWLAIGDETLNDAEDANDDPALWIAIFRSFTGLTWQVNNPPSGTSDGGLSSTLFDSMTATGDFAFTRGGRNYVLRFSNTTFDRINRRTGAEESDEDDNITRVVWYCSYQPGSITVVRGTSE